MHVNYEVRPFRAEALGAPTDLGEFQLPQGKPLDVEIGCGVGLHPIRYALANPERNLIAIEHTREKFASFRQRYEGNGHPANLFPIHADAIRWVTHALPPGSVSKFLLLYPNPEPKATNKRWIR